MLPAGLPKGTVTRRVISAIVYVAAAIATSNFLEFLLWNQTLGYQPVDILLRMAVVGSVTFGLAFLVAFFRWGYAVVLGSVAACFSWPYFGLATVFFHWRELARLKDAVYLGDGDETNVFGLAAIFFLLISTVYSLIEVWKWKRSREARIEGSNHEHDHGPAKVVDEQKAGGRCGVSRRNDGSLCHGG